jgi:hypothetical protein
LELGAGSSQQHGQFSMHLVVVAANARHRRSVTLHSWHIRSGKVELRI